MASKSGYELVAGIKHTATWGTAGLVAASGGCRIAGAITWTSNENELVARQIGSGRVMSADRVRGALAPTVSFAGDLGYRNNCDVILAHLFGTAAAPTEQTAVQGDELHTLTVNTALNAGGYLTLAVQTTSALLVEFPTCAVRSATISIGEVPSIVQFSAELLANDMLYTGATNTYANVTATSFTETNPELAFCDFLDTFRTNAQSGGAVAGGDQYNITSMTATYTRPQELPREIKGASGNSAPVSGGLFTSTLDINVKELADHAYYTIWSAETAQKAKLSFDGTQIGSGVNKKYALYFPRIKLNSLPNYGLSNEGTNTLGLSFTALVASANPTGMGSTMPYIEIINTLTTSLIA